MQFNSFEFIFVFLPVVYLGFLAAHRLAGWTGAFWSLAIASFAFYGLWSPALTLVLVLSVVANYCLGNTIMSLADKPQQARRMLIGGITANIVALGYFKYSNFLIDIANAVASTKAPHIKLILPVGMSFYTFVQIGYLIEAYNGKVARPSFERYAVFAAFFPCVTAGPLVLQGEMLQQMNDRKDRAFSGERLAIGMTMFAIGLFKKVMLADSIAPFADEVFGGAGSGQALTMTIAWIGAVAYALQLYFDFSGYSDMALGLGMIFGLRLPQNFDSPFKATSISDFWRRWHMTMTRFFTNYIFTPLAMRGIRSSMGGKQGTLARFLATGGIPALVTFVIAGVWHGAGWTFVVYGAVHGLAIAANLGWRELRLPAPPPLLGWLLTMSVVITGLVIFRAPSLAIAGSILSHMWIPGFLSSASEGVALLVIDKRMAVSMIVVVGSIALLMPNSLQIMHRYWVNPDVLPETARRVAGLLAWRPTAFHSVAVGVLLCIALASIGSATNFVYYQF